MRRPDNTFNIMNVGAVIVLGFVGKMVPPV